LEGQSRCPLLCDARRGACCLCTFVSASHRPAAALTCPRRDPLSSFMNLIMRGSSPRHAGGGDLSQHADSTWPTPAPSFVRTVRTLCGGGPRRRVAASALAGDGVAEHSRTQLPLTPDSARSRPQPSPDRDNPALRRAPQHVHAARPGSKKIASATVSREALTERAPRSVPDTAVERARCERLVSPGATCRPGGLLPSSLTAAEAPACRAAFPPKVLIVVAFTDSRSRAPATLPRKADCRKRGAAHTFVAESASASSSLAARRGAQSSQDCARRRLRCQRPS
jgi:hypothetical protein